MQNKRLAIFATSEESCHVATRCKVNSSKNEDDGNMQNNFKFYSLLIQSLKNMTKLLSDRITSI